MSLQQVDNIHTATQHNAAALMGALWTGAFLGEVHRRVGGSAWDPWVEEHCKDLEVKTAYKYMKLAVKVAHR